jgi:hypothetical protein
MRRARQRVFLVVWTVASSFGMAAAVAVAAGDPRPRAAGRPRAARRDEEVGQPVLEKVPNSGDTNSEFRNSGDTILNSPSP